MSMSMSLPYTSLNHNRCCTGCCFHNLSYVYRIVIHNNDVDFRNMSGSHLPNMYAHAKSSMSLANEMNGVTSPWVSVDIKMFCTMTHCVQAVFEPPFFADIPIYQGRWKEALESLCKCLLGCRLTRRILLVVLTQIAFERPSGQEDRH
jgi:hypothetical protein